MICNVAAWSSGASRLTSPPMSWAWARGPRQSACGSRSPRPDSHPASGSTACRRGCTSGRPRAFLRTRARAGPESAPSSVPKPATHSNDDQVPAWCRHEPVARRPPGDVSGSAIAVQGEHGNPLDQRPARSSSQPSVVGTTDGRPGTRRLRTEPDEPTETFPLSRSDACSTPKLRGRSGRVHDRATEDKQVRARWTEIRGCAPGVGKGFEGIEFGSSGRRSAPRSP
jgi:hypothetical protein